MQVVHRERALWRHEEEIEGRDREHRREDRRAAAIALRDEHHREQVDHRDIDEVEARMQREPDERTGEGRAHGPDISGNHAVTLAFFIDGIHHRRFMQPI